MRSNKDRSVSLDKQLRRIKRKKDKFIEASVPRKVASPVYMSYSGVRPIRPIF